MMLLRLLVFLFVGSLGQAPPKFPPEFHWEIPPFFTFDYSWSRQEYKLFINTQSPADWTPVGVSGTLYYDCKTNMKATSYTPFGLTSHFTQCMKGPDSKATMAPCSKDMFGTFWTNVQFFGKTTLSTGLPVFAWNVTINEPAWPALNLGGYEAYKLYFETAAVDPLLRTPVGLATDSMLLWWFKWSNNSTPVFVPSDCNTVEHISF